MARATVRIPLADAAAAKRAAASLAPDNGGHIEARIEGHTLILDAEAKGAMSLLRTFDDAMACLRATGIE